MDEDADVRVGDGTTGPGFSLQSCAQIPPGNRLVGRALRPGGHVEGEVPRMAAVRWPPPRPCSALLRIDWWGADFSL